MKNSRLFYFAGIVFVLFFISIICYASDTKIDINTASAKELMKLPGIGKITAESIIKYRQNIKKFSSIEDLMKIKGLGKKKFKKIKDLITIGTSKAENIKKDLKKDNGKNK